MNGTYGTPGTNGIGGVAGHFGSQMRRDRLAHGWDLRELAARSKIDHAHLSRIENGRRPPTARVATAMDRVFPERRGWYMKWFDDMRRAPEIPATFRDWSDYEDRSATLRAWTPSIIHGLAQTREYAAAHIATEPGLDARGKEARLAARMARQQRVLGRPHPPLLTLLTDEAALWRLVGTAEIMARQMRNLIELAARPNVVLQVAPEIGHSSLGSEFLIADDAVWAEHVIAGGVYVDPQTVTGTLLRFDTLRAECYRAGESLALLEEMEKAWSGGSLPTRGARAGRA